MSSAGSLPSSEGRTQNPVSVMPSGPKIRSARKSSNGSPLARATSTPSTSEPVLYSHRSPGWYISGSSPTRRIHSSGGGGRVGRGMPWASASSASEIGVGSPNARPSPNVNVSRSRTVMARRAGTVYSSGPSTRISTRRSASSGSRSSTGSSSRSTHSSTRIIAAAAVTGLLIDAMRKIVSRP